MKLWNPFEIFVAWRYLRSGKGETFVSVITWFSLIGIALGVATLIIVMSVMNGFRAELINRILGLNGHISVSHALSPRLVQYNDVAVMATDIDGRIQKVIPIVEGQSLLQRGRTTAGVVVRGISPDDLYDPQLSVVTDQLTPHGFDEFTDNTIIIGQGLAKRLGIELGDEITLISPQGRSTPFGTVPNSSRYNVGAIFDVGMYEYDANFIFMPLPAAQRFLGYRDAVQRLDIYLKDGLAEKTEVIEQELHKILGPEFQLRSWKRANNSFFNALKVERNVMFLILTLIILVAAFNIISSLIMLVKDKTRDIAIMRTYGVSRRSITRIFFLQGASVGIMGTITGVILGLSVTLNLPNIQKALESLTGTDLFAAEVYFLSQLPARVDMHEVIGVCVMALLLSFIATIYPAWRAARVDPVEALRYE